jgi:DNA repair exonuclease SbcCD ATPase subunit
MMDERPNDFDYYDEDYIDVDAAEDEFYNSHLPVRQKTPCIRTTNNYEDEYYEELYQNSIALEQELDNARCDNETIQREINKIIDEIDQLDERYTVDLFIQEEEIDALKRRIYELEDRNRHLEERNRELEPKTIIHKYPILPISLQRTSSVSI